MADCNFSIQSNLSPSEIIAKLKLSLKDHVGTFKEIEGGGELSINVFESVIRGIVVIQNSSVRVQIYSRDAIFSCEAIKHYLENIIQH